MTVTIPEPIAWLVVIWLYASVFVDWRLLHWRKRLTKATEECAELDALLLTLQK